MPVIARSVGGVYILWEYWFVRDNLNLIFLIRK